MSDEEEVDYEEEVEAEEAPRQEKPKPKPPAKRDSDVSHKKSEAEAIMLAQKKKHEEEEAQKLKEYEEQRRIQREKEEEELKQLKEKQERRRQEREEEDRLFAERRKEEEEKRRSEEEEKRKKADEDKRKKDEEKKKRQAMMAGLQSTGVTLELPKHDANQEKFNKFGNIVKAKAEMGLTKEQHEEQKRKHLQEIMRDLKTDNLDLGRLKSKLKEMHQRICRLEASRYDLEKRKERQEYDLKELNERQRQIARNKALKKGLDPDSATSSRYPPKVPTASKYDRQIDRRSYGDRRYLFESEKKKKQKSIYHGTARPPSEWGRGKENEELEQIRKNLEPPKYVEAVKLEGYKPPVAYIPSNLPEAEIVEEDE